MKAFIFLAFAVVVLGAIALYTLSDSEGRQPVLTVRRRMEETALTVPDNLRYTRSPMRECEGSCSVDDDCLGRLVCLQSSSSYNGVFPGCIGVDNSGQNFCVQPMSLPANPAPSTSAPVPSPTAGQTPSPTTSFNLPSTPTSAPVIAGPEKPQLELKGNNHFPASAFPLGQCQGDCDNDSECAEGLVCFQRDFTGAIPGCSGTPAWNHDYCINPADLEQPSDIELPGTPSEGFELKLYWEEGYFWQEENFERPWCLRCDAPMPECFPGQRVYLTECDGSTDPLSTFQFVNLPNGAFYIKILPSDLCLEIGANPRRETILAQPCDPFDEKQLFFARNGQAVLGDRFEIHPVLGNDDCVGNQHHPKFGEGLFVWPCSLSRAWTTALWQMI